MEGWGGAVHGSRPVAEGPDVPKERELHRVAVAGAGNHGADAVLGLEGDALSVDGDQLVAHPDESITVIPAFADHLGHPAADRIGLQEDWREGKGGVRAQILERAKIG